MRLYREQLILALVLVLVVWALDFDTRGLLDSCWERELTLRV